MPANSAGYAPAHQFIYRHYDDKLFVDKSASCSDSYVDRRNVIYLGRGVDGKLFLKLPSEFHSHVSRANSRITRNHEEVLVLQVKPE